MKKVTRAECLVCVAVVASAVALQIREHVQTRDASPTNPPAQVSSCGPSRDGLMPAACEQPTRNERQTDDITRAPHRARQIWV
jgi:hypothetical protein